eukprot:1823009-Pleurochrysis_carterae.AAC.1
MGRASYEDDGSFEERRQSIRQQHSFSLRYAHIVKIAKTAYGTHLLARERNAESIWPVAA